MLSKEVACLRQMPSGHFDRITRESLRHSSKISMDASAMNGWIVSEGDDQWQTLLHVIAGLEFGHSIFFAGSIYSQDEVEAAVARLPSSETARFAFLTSGSTGKPKTVIHSTEALVQAAIALSDAIPLGGRRMHHLFPPNYMAGVLNCVVLPWVTEGSVVVGSPFSFRTPLEMPFILGESQSEVAWLSPRMIRSLGTVARHQVQLRESLQRHWTLVVSATGPLDLATRDAFMELLQIPVLNTYGTTEHLFISAEKQESDKFSCGSLIAKNELAFATQLEDDFSENFLERSSGVVWAKTPFMATVVAEANQDPMAVRDDASPTLGFWQTGDVGRLHGGCLYIDHRADDMVVWDGMNISPRIYEDFANGNRSVIESMLSLVSHKGRDLLVLFAVTSDEKSRSGVIEEVWQGFGTWDMNLPAPSRVLSVEELPRTHTGKINRRGGQHLFLTAASQ
ncbi:MAG: hypothetical protein CMD33_08215 [Flavobacteriales bacterium]|nr:hypothetical protein [Flavobacteriales bacterium]